MAWLSIARIVSHSPGLSECRNGLVLGLPERLEFLESNAVRMDRVWRGRRHLLYFALPLGRVAQRRTETDGRSIVARSGD